MTTSPVADDASAEIPAFPSRAPRSAPSTRPRSCAGWRAGAR